MNEIFPRSGVAVDPASCAAEGRVAGERWLAINMVMSLDGAISVDGRSGGLAGPADRAMFLGLRAAAEVVLVGAETVRVERYHRAGAGQAAIAVVSGAARFPASTPLFDPAEPGALPLLLTGSASAERLERERWPAGRAELVVVGSDEDGSGINLTGMLEALAERGLRNVLCEGGPGLLTHLVAADLVDEWNVTLSPTLAGAGDSHMIGALERSVALQLSRVCESDGMLFLRYRRRSAGMTNA